MRKENKSLAETHPEVARQWHPQKNGELTPFNFTRGQNIKVWWKCEKGDDHEWHASPNKRALMGRGCPICSNQKIVLSNCLATTNPEIAKEWHPTKNGTISIYDIGAGSNKKTWWKCEKGDDHEWEISPNARTGIKKSNCPVCSNQKVVLSNCLATTNPEIDHEWHPTKNGNLTPYNLVEGSAKNIWWKCKKGDDHEWRASPSNRTKHNSNCPICSNQKVVLSNCLAITNPEIAKKWHPTKNGDLTPEKVTRGSERKVWWKCEKGDDHEWRGTIYTTQDNTCLVCQNKKVVLSNCLAKTNPKLAKEWHPTKNASITPFNIVEGSGKTVWWKCEKGDDHEWKATLSNRNKTNCPVCSNQKVVLSNCLATTNKEIAKEWHPTKNGTISIYDIAAGSNKKNWWKCEKGNDHEWETSPSNRTLKDSNCPYCTLTPQSKQELTITFELKKIFKNIDPKGLKTKLEGKLRAIDIFIPKLNLCIEFDGSYWHKDKRDIDKIKSEMLFKEGFKLIRVREEPLKKIYDTDVISKQPYNGKKVTNNILSMIILLFNLDDKLASKIKEYQSKEGLQNKKGLDKYIDKILTEKAENKNDS